MQLPKHPSPHPSPHGFPPLLTHKQTLILLHGRGSIGSDFSKDLLRSPLFPNKNNNNNVKTLQSALPHTKFIFPTAGARRARWYNRALINEWFDGVPIDEQDKHQMTREQEEWQLEGLREEGEVLRGIVEREGEVVGEGNVVLGGLSQGCAVGLWFLLGYGGRLGGFVGMSGWVPFGGDVEDIVASGEGEGDGDDPFATAGSPISSKAVHVCNYVREMMDLPPISETQEPALLNTPVFLGHGLHDEKVKVAKGRQAARILQNMGVQDVTWKEYDEGHWYKVPEQLDDLVAFLERCSSSLENA